MVYNYVPQKKWVKEGILSLLYVLVIIVNDIFLFLSLDVDEYFYAMLTLVIASAVFIAAGVYKAAYFFNLPKKEYLILGDSCLSIYRGNILSRKIIRFEQVDRVAKVNEVIVFRLDNGKEAQIYTDWLSAEDALELKKELEYRLDSKAVGPM